MCLFIDWTRDQYIVLQMVLPSLAVLQGFLVAQRALGCLTSLSASALALRSSLTYRLGTILELFSPGSLPSPLPPVWSPGAE